MVEQFQQPLDFRLGRRPAKRPADKRRDDLPGSLARRQLIAGGGNQQLVAGRLEVRRKGVVGVGQNRVDAHRGRFQVFLHQDRRQEQRRAVGVKAFAAGAVAGQQRAGFQVEAQQIADRVVVFGSGEPAAHDIGLVIFAALLVAELAAIDVHLPVQPGDQQFSLVVAGLGGLGRRHFAAADPLQRLFPRLESRRGLGIGVELLQIQLVVLLIRAVALVAEFGHQRLDLGFERRLVGSAGGAKQERGTKGQGSGRETMDDGEPHG